MLSNFKDGQLTENKEPQLSNAKSINIISCIIAYGQNLKSKAMYNTVAHSTTFNEQGTSYGWSILTWSSQTFSLL